MCAAEAGAAAAAPGMVTGVSTVNASPALLRVHPEDDVAVTLRDLEPGETADLDSHPVAVRERVPAGHKLALRPIPAGAAIRKFGWPIGRATVPISAGAHVHVHNLASTLVGARTYAPGPVAAPVAGAAGDDAARFLGYRRDDGRVGTRNEIWILCTVGCVGRTAERIAALARERFIGRVDGIHAFPHPFGCSQLGDDLANTRRLLGALARHPNAGGVLIIGLGCESNRLDALLDDLAGVDRTRLRAIAAQAAEDELEAGLRAVGELVDRAERDARTPQPMSALTIGLKCGGSDGFSGLTANPLLGRVADRVTAAGGSAILTEIPEIFGAEELLMRRAADPAVFAAIGDLVNGFKRYFLDHGQPVHENPSPGNRAGGITTLEEKSLGAVQKGGTAPVTGVLRYGERVARHGLALLEAPGNDAVSSTALAAAGATVILFTTGRGTPLGFPAPTLKIASNTDLARRKPGWIDFDAGRLLAEPAEAVAADLMELLLATASGKPTRAEMAGQREIAILKTGVTL